MAHGIRRLLPGPASAVDLAEAYPIPDAMGVHVRANMVASVDGAAMLDGRVGTLTGPADQQVLHALRAMTDVILVGASTVRAEGYGGALLPAEWLAYRRHHDLAELPRLAVVSGRLDLDFAGPPFTDAPTRPLLVTTSTAPAERIRTAEAVAEVVVVGGAGWVPMSAVLDKITSRGSRRVLCEGGPRLLGQLVAADLVDELCLTVTPVATCGDERRITDGPRLPRQSRLHLTQVLESEGHLFLDYARQR